MVCGVQFILQNAAFLQIKKHQGRMKAAVPPSLLALL